jgi:hypothetical protein
MSGSSGGLRSVEKGKASLAAAMTEAAMSKPDRVRGVTRIGKHNVRIMQFVPGSASHAGTVRRTRNTQCEA